MGRASRQKGSRVERLLVKELDSFGFRNARRVPFSGMMRGFKGDVIAAPPGDAKEILFEVKARRDAFGLVYALIDAHKKEAIGVWEESTKMGFYCSYCIYDLLPGSGQKRFSNSELFTDKNHGRAIKAVNKMKAWLGEAEILAIKQDHKSFLYIRFYD